MNLTNPIRCCAVLIGVTLLGIAAANAAPVRVTLSGLGFSAGRIAFDFIDGGAPNNSVSITESSLVGGPMDFRSGGVDGSLDSTLVLSDSAFFTEFSTLYSADVITFTFDPTDLGPSAGSLPDSFSVFLLTPDLPLTSLISTTDPTGADALLQFSIDGTADGQLNIYRDLSPSRVQIQVDMSVVPEPAPFLLLALGALIGLSFRRHKTIRKNNSIHRLQRPNQYQQEVLP